MLTSPLLFPSQSEYLFKCHVILYVISLFLAASALRFEMTLPFNV